MDRDRMDRDRMEGAFPPMELCPAGGLVPGRALRGPEAFREVPLQVEREGFPARSLRADSRARFPVVRADKLPMVPAAFPVRFLPGGNLARFPVVREARLRMAQGAFPAGHPGGDSPARFPVVRGDRLRMVRGAFLARHPGEDSPAHFRRGPPTAHFREERVAFQEPIPPDPLRAGMRGVFRGLPREGPCLVTPWHRAADLRAGCPVAWGRWGRWGGNAWGACPVERG
jgi:hypothetical protein